MASKSVKVRYNLNTFRMVSEGSDAIRHVKHGDLEKLKMCFETGEATLWDTAPDGWSLLHVELAFKHHEQKLTCFRLQPTTDNFLSSNISLSLGPIRRLRILGRGL